MEYKKYKELMEKLSKIIPHDDCVMQSVSPNQAPDVALAKSGAFIIEKNMDLSSLSNNELYYIHTCLHRFYPKGTKNLDREDIEKIHNDVKSRIKHCVFDQLDKK